MDVILVGLASFFLFECVVRSVCKESQWFYWHALWKRYLLGTHMPDISKYQISNYSRQGSFLISHARGQYLSIFILKLLTQKPNLENVD